MSRARAPLDLYARLRGRKQLSRIAKLVRVENRAHLLHERHVGGGEQPGHCIYLLDSDAVLAGDGSSHSDAKLQNLLAGLNDAMELVRIALIEKDTWMEIPVASVEDV